MANIVFVFWRCSRSNFSKSAKSFGESGFLPSFFRSWLSFGEVISPNDLVTTAVGWNKVRFHDAKQSKILSQKLAFCLNSKCITGTKIRQETAARVSEKHWVSPIGDRGVVFIFSCVYKIVTKGRVRQF